MLNLHDHTSLVAQRKLDGVAVCPAARAPSAPPALWPRPRPCGPRRPSERASWPCSGRIGRCPCRTSARRRRASPRTRHGTVANPERTMSKLDATANAPAARPADCLDTADESPPCLPPRDNAAQSATSRPCRCCGPWSTVGHPTDRSAPRLLVEQSTTTHKPAHGG